MPRPPRWTTGAITDGLVIITLSSWRYFADFVNRELLDYRTYIFRGHASDSWKLESTLDRALKGLPAGRRLAARRKHLENFQFAARGRRGSAPARLEGENDWWALGQHHGLATPLLDWTESPFVALYFAFEDEDNGKSDFRAVWGVSKGSIEKRAHELEKGSPGQSGLTRITKRPNSPECQVVRPLTDENARLVSQRGLFVRGPDGVALEAWIRKGFQDDSTNWHIFKIRVPDKDRTDCLRSLNRMNINHLSLFPDLYGASRFCNLDLKIKNY